MSNNTTAATQSGQWACLLAQLLGNPVGVMERREQVVHNITSVYKDVRAATQHCLQVNGEAWCRVAGGGHDGNVTGDGGCVQGLIRVKKDVMAMIRGGSGLRPSLVDIGTGGPLTTDAL